jgi:hypothetical protein
MIQGQIQVGPSHQARLPPIQTSPVELCESHEELVWKPDTIADVDLLMYLRAARSMAAFVGWCDGGSTDDGCAAASMDETTVSSLQLLHDNSYDTGRALQALVKIINPKSADRRWSDDDAKRFVKGLKQHGKNFFKIRRDLLPAKNTAQLVEYYYLWKKSATASTTRPHRRHRRPVLRRQAPTPTPTSSESVEEPSDGSENEMESDEGSDRVASSKFVCMRCQTTESKSWFRRGGKRSGVVCAACRPLCSVTNDGATVPEPPPFMFRPVKDEDQTVDGEHQLESGSSMEASPETSDEGRPGSAERVSPSSASARSTSSSSSGTGRASALEKEQRSVEPQSKCSSPVGGVVVKSEEVHVENSSSVVGESSQPCVLPLNRISDGSGTSPIKSIYASPEHWKHLEQRVQQPSVEDTLKSNSGIRNGSGYDGIADATDYRGLCESVIKREMGNVCEPTPLQPPAIAMMMNPSGNMKVEEPNSSSSGYHMASSPLQLPLTQWSDPRSASSRAVMSVAPCAAPVPPPAHSPWKCSPPPPLLHTVPQPLAQPPPILVASVPQRGEHLLPSRSPIGFSMQRSSDREEMLRMSRDGESDQSNDEDSQQDRGGIPSPEPRIIHEEFYRSTSAVLVRRWFRGRTTCARCDIEFAPPPGTPLAAKREAARSRSAGSKSAAAPPLQPTTATKDVRRSEMRKEDDRKKNRTPPENRSFDAQITSTLMSTYGGDLTPGNIPRGAGPPFPAPIGHSATPALQKLSEYIRPHAAAAAAAVPEPQRYMSYGPGMPPQQPPPPPPPQGVEAYFGMPGSFLSGWEAVEREIAKEKRERDVWEREMRELEFAEKMRQELAVQGLDRLILPGTPYWEELQRAYGPLGGLGGLPPQMAANIPGFFPPPGINMEFVQRERERIEALRLSQEQQQQLAAAMAAAGNHDNAAAIYQLFQKYSQDPAMLQRHLLAMSSPKDQELARMMDASSLIYHFARADPLAGAATSGAGPSTGMPQGLPPQFAPQMPEHPMIALAQNYERMCMDLLSRPPYNADPMLAQQLMLQLSAQHESMRHQLAAREREGIASSQNPPPPSLR